MLRERLTSVDDHYHEEAKCGGSPGSGLAILTAIFVPGAAWKLRVITSREGVGGLVMTIGGLTFDASGG